MDGWLSEQLKTIKNLCAVTQLLIDVGRGDLIPTVLELLQIEVQEVIEENCIADMPNNKDVEIDYK